jgi:hypothetical protein
LSGKVDFERNGDVSTMLPEGGFATVELGYHDLQ